MVYTQEEGNLSQTQRGDGHVMTGTEPGDVPLQAQENPGTLALGGHDREAMCESLLSRSWKRQPENKRTRQERGQKRPQKQGTNEGMEDSGTGRVVPGGSQGRRRRGRHRVEGSKVTHHPGGWERL